MNIHNSSQARRDAWEERKRLGSRHIRIAQPPVRTSTAKFSPDARTEPVSRLTLGKTEYARMRTGSLIRVSPVRPWHGKSERRRVIVIRHSMNPR